MEEIITDSLFCDNCTVLTSLLDSLSVISADVSRIVDNSRPEPYTVDGLRLSRWNLIVSIIAALFGSLGALFGYFGYRFSKLTANNVAKVSADTQRALCLDFSLDLYHHTVMLISYINDCENGRPPAVEAVLRLRIAGFDEVFHIDAFNRNKETYLLVKHIRDRIRDYDDNLNICVRRLEKGDFGASTLKVLKALVAKPVYIMYYVARLFDGLNCEKSVFRNLRRLPKKETDLFSFLLEKHLNHLNHSRGHLADFEVSRLYEYRRLMESQAHFELFLKQIIGLHIRNMENYSATINADLLSGALEFVGAINVMHEYRNLLRKGCWTKDEMLTLMKDMLAVDALVR